MSVQNSSHKDVTDPQVNPAVPAVPSASDSSLAQPGNEPGAGGRTANLASGSALEALVPLLGDVLVERGLISTPDLQQALAYQKQAKAQGRPLLLGQALVELSFIDRSTLDDAIAEQLTKFQQALQDANRRLEAGVQARTQDLQDRLLQIRTAAEVTQLAISSANLQALYQRTVELIVERFNYYSAAIFIKPEGAGDILDLAAAAGPMSQKLIQRGLSIQIGSQSMIGWTAAYNQARIADDIRQEAFFQPDDLLTGILSEASIPIAASGKTIGVLDVQANQVASFDPDAVAVLQTISNHIAAVVQNFHLLDTAQRNLRETTALYHASQKMGRVTTTDQVFTSLAEILSEMSAGSTGMEQPGVKSILWQRIGRAMHVHSMQNITPAVPSATPVETQNFASPTAPAVVNTEPMALVDAAFPEGIDLLSLDLLAGETAGDAVPTLPASLLAACRFGSHWVALIPMRANTRLAGLLVIGTESPLDDDQGLPTYTSLAKLTSTALEKVSANVTMEKRLGLLQALNTISQAVSLRRSDAPGSDLDEMYRMIHHQVTLIMGEISFTIALYDPMSNYIQISYMVDYQSDSVVDTAQPNDAVPSRVIPKSTSSVVEPFPLGQGLTSVLINTRKPLLLNYDTENRAKALGAKIIGKPAKSWLGVPLLVGGEVIGAIIVQDSEQDGRFDEDDQRLLETLASQVAVAIRNARLLESTRWQAERERRLREITGRIRSAIDMQAIMEITAQELQKTFNAHRASVEVDPAAPSGRFVTTSVETLGPSTAPPSTAQAVYSAQAPNPVPSAGSELVPAVPSGDAMPDADTSTAEPSGT